MEPWGFGWGVPFPSSGIVASCKLELRQGLGIELGDNRDELSVNVCDTEVEDGVTFELPEPCKTNSDEVDVDDGVGGDNGDEVDQVLPCGAVRHIDEVAGEGDEDEAASELPWWWCTG